MRRFTLALALSAIPAAAFGQTVSCPDCRHVASWFRGEGGFIATVADGADEVVFVASCGSVSITGEARVSGGTAAQIFDHRNGLACDRDGGSLEIAGLKDGGWYWITDDRNSAVGSLVSKDVLDHATTDITSAGAGVEMTPGKGAVYLKETATGRVGILPNILPEPPAGPALLCGPRRSPDWPYPYDRQAASGCMLGGGGTKIRLVGPGAYGARAAVATGMVTRPTTGSITVTADLWLDESGSYTTTASDAGTFGADLRRGWVGRTAAGQSDHDQNWLGATFTVTLDSGDPQTGDLAGAGVEVAETGSGSTPTGQASITISSSSDYCPSSAGDPRHTATLNVAATPGTNAIHPPVATGEAAGFTEPALATVAAVTQLRIVCAP